MFLLEVAVIALLGLGILIALTGFLGFALMIYGISLVYKDENR